MFQRLKDLPITQGTNVFQMTNAQCYKIMPSKRFIQSPDKPMDFNVTEYQIFSDMVSDSMLQLTFKKLQLVDF